MLIKWNEEKNKILRETRKICFEDLINDGEILKIIKNTSSNHKDQEKIIILFNNKLYAIPFVREKNGDFFLKTAYRSRNLDKLFEINNKKGE
jgi:hypothetical protein